MNREITPAFHAYFRAYLVAHNIEDASEIKNWEYIRWILARHRKFREARGLKERAPYTPEQQDDFEQFLGRRSRDD